MGTRPAALWTGGLLTALWLSDVRGAEPYESAFKRGKALQGQGQTADAVQAFEDALKQGGPAHIRLIIAKVWLSAGKPERALQEVTRYRQSPSSEESLAAPLEAAARSLRPAPEPPKPATDLVRIKPGSFTMGSHPHEPGRDSDELQHEVAIGQAFLLGRREVTRAEFQAVMGGDGLGLKGAHRNLPVVNVSWFDAVRYCNARSRKEGFPACYQITGEEVGWKEGLLCRGYRLPTEAEWEYAARAGQASLYSGSNDYKEVAWDDSQAHPGGEKRPNKWGLFDMSSNVWEWVWDWKADFTYGSVSDPLGPESGSWRVRRGGSSWNEAKYLRVASRFESRPSTRLAGLGFRVARSLLR